MDGSNLIVSHSHRAFAMDKLNNLQIGVSKSLLCPQIYLFCCHQDCEKLVVLHPAGGNGNSLFFVFPRGGDTFRGCSGKGLQIIRTFHANHRRGFGHGNVLLTSIWFDVLSDVLVMFGRSFASDWLCERFFC